MPAPTAKELEAQKARVNVSYRTIAHYTRRGNERGYSHTTIRKVLTEKDDPIISRRERIRAATARALDQIEAEQRTERKAAA